MKSFTYGLDVLDRSTGQPLFDSEKLHKDKEKQIGDMTNLLVLGDVVYYASQRSFRAFDLNRLDNNYLVAQGQTQGDFDGVKSVTAGDNGSVVLLMKQTTTAFSPADGSVLWSQSFEPPKASALAVGLLNALSAVEAQSRANRSMTGRATYRTYGQSDFYQGRSAASDQYNYVMGQQDKKPTVIGVNLTKGQADRRATMDKKEADYAVDERFGLLVNVEKKKTVQVYDMN